jgi:hypothetical protein
MRLRALRASPPGLAAKDKPRRQVFAAALGQFDELLTAAGAIGPASAPLPLYYALNQAGRAIAAAHQPNPNRWQPRSHGLKVGHPGRSLGQTLVTPDPPPKRGKVATDSFRVIAGTTGSWLLTGSVMLGELWAAAPGTERVRGLGLRHNRAAQVEPVGAGAPAILGRIRGPELEGLTQTRRSGPARKRLERAYPVARSGMNISLGLVSNPHPEIVADLHWRTASGITRSLGDVTTRFPGPQGAHYLMPGLGQNDDVLSPLMVWWAVLYSLSHLARYQPASWTAALDPVESPLATPIEGALAYAREVMPQVVYSELLA